MTMAGTYRLARTRCTNPSCRTETVEVVEDAVHTLMCDRCRQYNAIVEPREAIADGKCGLCKKTLDDHQWVGDQAVCRRA